jgi:diguanylate cyclase (GGDEF)-like protein/PAS domain S-box-containing protein
MNKAEQTTFLDHFGLIIIGAIASIIYWAFEKIINSGQDISIAIAAAVILTICGLSQFLLNTTKEKLRTADKTLEASAGGHMARHEFENNYRAIFENTGTPTIIIDENMIITSANKMFVNLSGYKRKRIENKKEWLDFLDANSRKSLLLKNFIPEAGSHRSSEPHTTCECKFIAKNNDTYEVLVSWAALPDANRWVVSLTVVTTLKEADEQTPRQALHDTLTGLPNRALFMEYLTLALKRANRNQDYEFVVLYLDIDRFKLINDSLSQGVGDQLLLVFADRLKRFLRDGDTLARFGEDQFAILLEDIKHKDFALKVAQRLQTELQAPFILDGKDIFAPASFGIVRDTRSYNQAEEIIRDADAAMFHAKKKGRAQFQVFEPKLRQKALELLHIETDLRKAIDKKEFELYYQPIVSLETGAIIGLEALIRWNHPQQGMIGPVTFIPVAEETGLIIPIGRWVLRQACHDLVRWQKKMKHLRSLFISVNISGKQFLMPSLIDDVHDVIKECGLSAERLMLEITETTLMENTDETFDLIKSLKKDGIQIVIDDFGTGYSSMSYLQQLPVDTIKMDRSFVSKIRAVPDQNKKIVETIISLAHILRMNVVAEGVETREQHDVLSGMKCQLAQGYLFSRPLSRQKMNEILLDCEKFSRLNPDLQYTPCDLVSL